MKCFKFHRTLSSAQWPATVSFRKSRKTTQEQLRKTKTRNCINSKLWNDIFHKIILSKPKYSLTLSTIITTYTTPVCDIQPNFCFSNLVLMQYPCLSSLNSSFKSSGHGLMALQAGPDYTFQPPPPLFNSFFSNESGLSGDLLVCLFHLFWKRTFGDKCHGFLLSTQQQNKLWTGCHGTFYSQCHQSLTVHFHWKTAHIGDLTIITSGQRKLT